MPSSSSPASSLVPGGSSNARVLWEDDERVFCRRWRDGEVTVLVMFPTSEHPTPGLLARLAHEYELKDELDSRWAVRPRELALECGRLRLLFEDPGGEPLAQLLGRPMETGRFLHLALGLSTALAQMHARGLIHKDIKPANVLVDSMTGQAWLTGFGIATRLPRERHSPEQAPEVIAGTLAYMAPEQTGRMNRSIDSRCDLYSLGVTFYEMLTASLPFTASDPMEWVHCHIARVPLPPGERVHDVPAAVSAIILKLLAKTPEERYQTAAGVEADLRKCRTLWQSLGHIETFPLAEHDRSDRLLMPEKLYGREHESRVLLDAFQQVVATGAPTLVVVCGYSGIGKSSVVNELHKAIVPAGAGFISGRFDQYKRDIPYATIAQAFQTLIRHILSQSDAEVAHWRDSLQAAVGRNGRLVITFIPELEWIIGVQPVVLELPPMEAESRFHSVFRSFLSVFASKPHPLALFLDDLQWADSATLKLIRDLLAHPEGRHLLLIGAFRDNEVGPAHPLAQTLDAIRATKATVRDIVLAPLSSADVIELVGDTLRCGRVEAEPLAQLVHEKTLGNPFFVIQFLTALWEERLLDFDALAKAWQWDLTRIHARGFTDNVVDLMISKLERFPIATQDALKNFACLGNAAAIDTLAMVQGKSEEDVHSDLSEVVRAGLIFRQEERYTFLHDRVQEAAYALIAPEERAAFHLKIGRMLAAHIPAQKRQEMVFEIVNHLNRAIDLIRSREEREQLAELNLIAGRRAKASTAYASALTYLNAGDALLAEGRWERAYELSFALAYNRAECAFLTGRPAAAEDQLAELAHRAKTFSDLATVTCLRVAVFMTSGESVRAIEVGLACLRSRGIEWLPQPTEEEVRQELERIQRMLGGRAIEALIDLAPMSDPDSCATMDVLAAMLPPAHWGDKNLYCLVIARMVNLSLEHGNDDASCIAYSYLGSVLGPYFGDDYQTGYQFGELAINLVEQRGLDRFRHRVYLLFAHHIVHWVRHLRSARALARRGIELAHEAGDRMWKAYGCMNLVTNLLVSGDPLDEVQREAERALEVVQQEQYGLVVALIKGQLRLIRTLRGLTPVFGSFDESAFNEERFEHYVESTPDVEVLACWHWIRKLQARLSAGDVELAVAAAEKAKPFLWTSPSFLETAEYHFYAALARAAACDTGAPQERAEHSAAFSAHCEQISKWAENCPENFAHRRAILSAERARHEARDLDALHLYEEGARLAHEHGFVQNEAIAHELAGRFHLARGLETSGNAHLRSARSCYALWGASGKVKQLDRLYAHLAAPDESGPTATIGSPVQQLDVATVVKASQAVSSEIVLPRLIERLMTIALENAGADRGLMFLPKGDQYLLEAEARSKGDTVEVVLSREPVPGRDFPETLLRYVSRTQKSVILDDASRPNLFSEDEYLRRGQTRSVMCLPLLKQSRLTGLLYLENTLTSHAFTPDRVAVLDLLAGQAAISLENTRLYGDLQERESRIRRLVDSNIIGIFIWNLSGQLPEANEAFLHIIGYSREDLLADRVRWTELTPAEWRDADERAVAELRATGSCQPYEKEFLHKHGRRVPVLIGAATFQVTSNEGVAFVIDLTERKRAEESLRESERRYSEAQMALAHANRVTTTGQLTATIAHEINQPLAATVTNAEAALNWLHADPPMLSRVRLSLLDIIQDGHRAGAVIDRIRSLFSGAPARQQPLDLNETIRDVIALTRAEVQRNRVLLRTQLGDSLPEVHADRIQLQQVMLNLIVNATEAMSAANAHPRELLIKTAPDDADGVRVAVLDTGPGLSPESHERLFTAFYTTKPSGLGLGLSICRSIIEAHHGRLWASANTPRGAIFQFTLPAQPKNPL